MEKFRVSIVYQILYFILTITCIHSGVIRLFTTINEMVLTFQLTLPLIILIALYLINIVHFSKLKIQDYLWAPVIFKSNDEREQKIMNEVSSKGFKIIFPLCVVIGFAFIFVYGIFQSFIGNMNQEYAIYIILDLFWSAFSLPYIIYTIKVYQGIKKV